MFKLFESSLGTVFLPSHCVASPNFRTCLWRGAFQFPASLVDIHVSRLPAHYICQKLANAAMFVKEHRRRTEKLLSSKRVSVVSTFNTQSSIESVKTGVE